MVNILCVVDNTAQRSSQLWAEHGVTFWVTTDQGHLLFDTGQSGTVLLHNLEILDLDPQTLDALAISHAHYDHTGGLPALLEHIRPNLPLYANPDLFRARASKRQGEFRAIGIAGQRASLAQHVTLNLDATPQQIFPGVWTTGEITQRPEPVGRGAQHYARQGENWVADSYQDDMSLVIDTDAGLVVLCGCCHAGLLNTLLHVRRTFERPIVTIAGGTHLANANTDGLNHIAQTLDSWNTIRHIYLNHCSGENAYYVLRQTLGRDVVTLCPAGTRIMGGEV